MSNKRIKESFVKYLAGIIDADGCLSFTLGNKYCGLVIAITQVEVRDKGFRMMRHLEKNLLGLGQLKFNGGYTTANNLISRYYIQKRSDLNQIIPRLLKHLVMKGKHFKRMFKVWKGLRGKRLTASQIVRLKKFAKWSRTCDGSIKHKKHPTWAWVAGYLDGDGCFHKSDRRRMGVNGLCTWTEIRLQVVSHEKDRVGIELLKKAFKGGFSRDGQRPHLICWRRNLGNQDYSFAIRFLPKVLRYSIVNKYKIERILEYHNKHHKQRLNNKNSTE